MAVTLGLFVKKLSGKGLFPFLLLFVTSIVASGFFIAKVAESIKYQEDAERAVQLSKETPEVQYYLVNHPDAQYWAGQDKYHWLVYWSSPSSMMMHVVYVTIDKTTWKIVDVTQAW